LYFSDFQYSSAPQAAKSTPQAATPGRYSSVRFCLPVFAFSIHCQTIKNKLIMQQEDDLRGLAKVMDFMRALSILLENVRRKKLNLIPAGKPLFQQETAPAKRYFFTFPFSFQLCCKWLIYSMKIL
jgi:hypothetical protein